MKVLIGAVIPGEFLLLVVLTVSTGFKKKHWLQGDPFNLSCVYMQVSLIWRITSRKALTYWQMISLESSFGTAYSSPWYWSLQKDCRYHLLFHLCCLRRLVSACWYGKKMMNTNLFIHIKEWIRSHSFNLRWLVLTRVSGLWPFCVIRRAVQNAGGVGEIFQKPATTDSTGWGVLYGITSILGAWSAGTLGQSDWTRYSERPRAPTLSQLIAAPVTITVTAVIGIIVTSAANDIVGEIIWSPIQLLAAVQENYDSSPRVRAGVFFASVGTVSTQLAVSFFFNFWG